MAKDAVRDDWLLAVKPMPTAVGRSNGVMANAPSPSSGIVRRRLLLPLPGGKALQH